MSKRNPKPTLCLPPGATVGAYLLAQDPAHIAPSTTWSQCTVINGATYAGDSTMLRGPNGERIYRYLSDIYVATLRRDGTPGVRWKRVDHAAEHPNARGLWWWSKEGDARRVATTLEVALYDDGIVVASGWTLATPEGEELPWPAGKMEIPWCAPFACCSLDKPKPEKPKPVFKTADEKKLARARMMHARATTRVKRATTIEKKWAKEVRRLERKGS